MEYLYISPEHFKVFLLVVLRIGTVLFLFPFFGSNMVPKTIKGGLTLILGFVVYPVVPVNMDAFPDHVFQLPILVLSELLIGLVLGLSLRLFYTAVQFAGQLIGFQAGFGMMNVVDPQTGTSATVTATMGLMITSLLFIILNGHHVLILGLIESFRLVDVGGVYLNHALFNKMLALSADLFVIGLKIGAPGIAALLFVSIAFGLSAKFSPQMNILIVAFPVKIAVGLFFFALMLQVVLLVTRNYVDHFDRLIKGLLILLGGG